jgi:nicotinate dehydrogenase subunit A
MRAAREFIVQVNGQPHVVQASPQTPLLQVLRNDLGLNGPKYGCGLGECGACAVLVDGCAARACVLPLAGLGQRAVTTLEGLAHVDASGRRVLHPVQQAFIDAQAAQCGYCLNGMLIATVALLRQRPRPTADEVRAALSHNLCRCGSHLEILAAVDEAARRMAGAADVSSASSVSGLSDIRGLPDLPDLPGNPGPEVLP